MDECLNEGYCSSPNTCICPVGFTGNQCETSKKNAHILDPSVSLQHTGVCVCLNNGACTDENLDGSCTCPAGWGGSRCEIGIPYTLSQN